MMRHKKRAEPEFVVNSNSFSFVLQRAHDVMIAYDKLKTDSPEMFHYFTEHFPLRIIMTVKKIAETYYPGRFCMIDQVNEDLKIFIAGFLGNGNSRLSE